MPTSSKRPQRVRREVVKDIDMPDSSPSRPAKRRKKAGHSVSPNFNVATTNTKQSDARLEKEEAGPVVLSDLPDDRSGIPMNDEELICTIVPSLLVPDTFVQATQDNANKLHEKHSKQGVQAYAKLAGKDWTFYIKRLRNNIGRPPEGHVAPPLPIEANSLEETPEDGNFVHVDLGPSKMISRSHAEIIFDSDSEHWNITVLGRNGIKINNEPFKRGDVHALGNGEVIEIGGVEMMFVLPQEDGSLKIANFYLHRAGLISTPYEKPKVKDGLVGFESSSQGLGLNRLSGGPTLIAPAPPDYKRPGTPVSAKPKGQYSASKGTPGFAGGTMLLNSDDVDLSRDSNQHIKPSYSYSQLISQAILDTEDEKLTLNGIYTFIMDKYAYYRHQLGGGWQNSIRHNLSLNKAFEKVARETNEPGKGMKWHIKDDHRDEMAKNAVRGGRGGHRGSPGSPGVLNRVSRGSLNSPVRRNKRSPRSGSPPLSSYPSNASQFTPDRHAKINDSLQEDLPGDGSPLPRHRRSYGLNDNAPGSPPILSSSYMQDDSTSFVTPAPLRVHPRLAPPSTAQRPSQHMPTSSPAPFWKYADIGSTPLKGAVFDSSPVKGSSHQPPESSSPVSVRSPTRNGDDGGTTSISDAVVEIVEDDDPGIDLTRGFQSIGSYHAPRATLGVTTGISATHSLGN